MRSQGVSSEAVRSLGFSPWYGVWLALWCVLGGLETLHAQPVCTNELVRMVAKEMADRTEFYVTNLQTVEVTITVEMKLTNMRSSVAFPYTQVFAGGRQLPAFTLWKEEGNRRWDYRYSFRSTFGNHRVKHDDQHRYRLPFAPGERFRVVQAYNGKFSHFGEDQYAIDWTMPEGTQVLAARQGVVAAIKDDSAIGGPNAIWKDCANFVMVRHPDGTLGHYVHLRRGGAKVKLGQVVQAGDLLGLSGNTGYSQGPHLHFAVFKAKDGRARETLPVKFDTDLGEAMTLIQGGVYAVPP